MRVSIAREFIMTESQVIIEVLMGLILLFLTKIWILWGWIAMLSLGPEKIVSGSIMFKQDRILSEGLTHLPFLYCIFF